MKKISAFCCVSPSFWLLFLSLTVGAVAADNLRVPADFRNISAALAAAAPGDTVSLSAGTYTGPANCNLLINKNNITLVGVDGPAVTVIDCERKSRCVAIVGAQSVTVSGLWLRNGEAPGSPTDPLGTTRSSKDTARDVSREKRGRALPERRRPQGGGKWKRTVAVVRVVVDSDGELSYESGSRRLGERKRQQSKDLLS